MGEEVDVPALRAKEGEIGDRRLAAGQDDEVGETAAARPGWTKTSRTAGSSRSGSKSSKLAMRGSIGTAIVTSAVGARFDRRQGRTRPRPAGAPRRRRTAARPKRAPAGALGDRRHAAGEQARVAAELVDDEADDHRGVVGRERRLAFRESGRKRRRDRCRRSARPGSRAARAKPMLAMSPSRRLISAALPAPSTSTRSASASRRAKLSSTAAQKLGLQRLIFARLAHCRSPGPARRPARRSRSAASAAPGSCRRSARRRRRAPAAPARGRSRRRPASPRRCSTCSAA